MNFNKRKWLNPRNSEDNGWISYSVRNYWDAEYNKKGSVHADFMLADCSRTITLAFGAYTPKGFDMRLRKVDLLIESLLEFRDKMEDAYAENQEHIKKGS